MTIQNYILISDIFSMVDYKQEQLKELYQNLPKELQEALYSEKNGDYIQEICERSNIKKELRINLVSKFVGHVLLGLLPPANFGKKIQRELGLKKEKADQIALEINRFVFLPSKESLEKLYQVKLKEQDKKAKILSKKTDSYREAIE